MSRQWTLPLEISEFKADDYGKLAHVFGSIFPDYDRTPEEWRLVDERLDKAKIPFKTYSFKTQKSQETRALSPWQQVAPVDYSKKILFHILGHPPHQKKGRGGG